jgi:hypothetical protein
MFDLSAFQPFVIGFFVIAAVAIGLAVATLVTLSQERRTTTGRVIAISAAHPAAAAVTRRAA